MERAGKAHAASLMNQHARAHVSRHRGGDPGKVIRPAPSPQTGRQTHTHDESVAPSARRATDSATCRSRSSASGATDNQHVATIVNTSVDQSRRQRRSGSLSTPRSGALGCEILGCARRWEHAIKRPRSSEPSQSISVSVSDCNPSRGVLPDGCCGASATDLRRIMTVGGEMPPSEAEVRQSADPSCCGGRDAHPRLDFTGWRCRAMEAAQPHDCGGTHCLARRGTRPSPPVLRLRLSCRVGWLRSCPLLRSW
jgi:hypothetical protein